MHRFLSMFLFLPLILVFFSCTADEKIDISASSNVDTFSAIAISELQSMMEEKQDFVLLLSNVSCTSCIEFTPIINGIISEKQIVVYKVETGPGFTPQNDIVPYEFTPTFVVFSDGIIISKIDAFNNPDEFLTESAFTDYLRQFIVLD